MQSWFVTCPLPDASRIQAQVGGRIEVMALQNGIPAGILAINWIPVPEMQYHTRCIRKLSLHCAGKWLCPAQIMGKETRSPNNGRCGRLMRQILVR